MYPNNHDCIFEGPPIDPQRLLVMEVAFFSTDYSDALWVNGVRYSGNVGPHGEVQQGIVRWSADAPLECSCT